MHFPLATRGLLNCCAREVELSPRWAGACAGARVRAAGACAGARVRARVRAARMWVITNASQRRAPEPSLSNQTGDFVSRRRSRCLGGSGSSGVQVQQYFLVWREAFGAQI